MPLEFPGFAVRVPWLGAAGALVLAPAIAAGCPFILKPASSTPVGALLIGEILAETELPAGAFSILPCRRDGARPARLMHSPRPVECGERVNRFPSSTSGNDDAEPETGEQLRELRRSS